MRTHMLQVFLTLGHHPVCLNKATAPLPASEEVSSLLAPGGKYLLFSANHGGLSNLAKP